MLINTQINLKNNIISHKPQKSSHFCGLIPYFKHGAIITPENNDEFVKKYAFTTKKQILQTPLRPLPTDKEISNQILKLNFDNPILKNIFSYMQNPSKAHPVYDEFLETDERKIQLMLQGLYDVMNSSISQNPTDNQKILKEGVKTFEEHKKFILHEYKKRGLKDFLISQLFNSKTDKNTVDLIYLIKTKYFDANLDEDVKKIVQKTYDDFKIILFPVNDKNLTLSVYDAIQEAYKIPLSVRDVAPKIKVIDTTSIYKFHVDGTGFYDQIHNAVNVNPIYLNEINTTLKHEISGHAMHYIKDPKEYITLFRPSLTEHLKTNGLKLNFFKLYRLFNKSRILDYQKRIRHMSEDPLEGVATLKEYLNIFNFEKVENSFKIVQEILEVCKAPQCYFADRIILPKQFKPSQWQEFSKIILQNLK
jgi:hypothetical protein